MLIVIYHHGLFAKPFESGLLNKALTNASLAVSYFFVLSGFIIGYVYQGTDFSDKINRKNFWVARFARIYPLYLLAFVLVLFTMMVLKHSHFGIISILLQLLCLQTLKPGIVMEINYVGWSISVELFFYLLFPFLMMYWRKKSTGTILLQSLMFWLGNLVLHFLLLKYLFDPARYNVGQFIAFFPLLHLNTFIIGLAASIACKTYLLKHTNKTLWGYLFLLSASIAIYYFFIINPAIINFTTNGGMAMVFVFIVLGLCLINDPFTKILSFKPLVWLGNSSYGIYLLQWFVFMWFAWFYKPVLTHPTTIPFYIYCFVLVLFSGLVYELFEKPLRNMINSRYREKI